MSSKAVYIDDDGNVTVRTLPADAYPYSPQAGEVLVSVKYTGINPADFRHARELGIRSTIAGYDFVGTVKSVGPDCTKGFKPGDVIAGTTPTEGIGRPEYYGAHQDELLCPEICCYLVPPGLPLEAAAVLTVSVRTASDGVMFNLGFKLPATAPSTNGNTSSTNGTDTTDEPDANKSLLIWGGGTSCGVSAVQIARLCGASPIIVTASPQHHARLKELGATHCFDYRSPSVVPDIQALGKSLFGPAGIRHGYDCIGLSGPERQGHMAPVTASCCGPDAKIVSVIPMPPFLGAWASPERPAFFKPFYLGGEVVATPVDQERALQSMAVLEWVARNYGEGSFVFPNIKVVKGGVEKAREAVLQVGKVGSGMTKWAVEHPY